MFWYLKLICVAVFTVKESAHVSVSPNVKEQIFSGLIQQLWNLKVDNRN